MGPGTGGVVTPSLGINYGSISFSQLSGHIVFCILLIGVASPPYRYGTKYNVARKLAKRNEAIIYAKAGNANPSCPWPHLWSLVKLLVVLQSMEDPGRSYFVPIVAKKPYR